MSMNFGFDNNNFKSEEIEKIARELEMMDVIISSTENGSLILIHPKIDHRSPISVEVVKNRDLLFKTLQNYKNYVNEKVDEYNLSEKAQ